MHQAHITHRGAHRKGKGFTCAEAHEAGITTCEQFDALKLPWDSRRKTKYAENVAYLKTLAKPEAKPAKPKTAKK